MANIKHNYQTPATQWLDQRGVDYETASYAYIEHGGTKQAAQELSVDEYQVIKTLVMQDERERPLLILMHGNMQVSTKKLARQIGAKHIQPCKPEVAQRHSGYLVGGTSPFGIRKDMPIYVEKTILSLDKIMINGGRRGCQVFIAPQVLVLALHAKPVECAIAL